MKSLVDPRQGDVEDDASSTKSNSLLAMAGSLLGEISFTKLFVSWCILIIVPAVVLGLGPLVATAWAAKLAGSIVPAAAGIVPLAFLLGVALLGWWFGWRFFRLVESSFWSLNALVVEPVYTIFREALRHLAELALPDDGPALRRERYRSLAAGAAGVLIGAAALALLAAAWPWARWVGSLSDLTDPATLAWIALVNTVVVVSAYVAVAALAWGFADATMPPPRDLKLHATALPAARIWRVAHLSDIHIVGERYGFRIESGRTGPQGDMRFRRILDVLEEIDSAEPLDLILLTGDATDAGRSVEWAEFLDGLASHPRLGGRVLMLPGNHDVNIVDRANPARLDLSIGPNARLRKIRTLSAMNAVQGARVRVVHRDERRLGATLAETLEKHSEALKTFADSGRPIFSSVAADQWAEVFPMVVPPELEDGVGVVLLNSNADSHFSFTNALGLVPAEQVYAAEAVFAQYPKACWLIGLHHHPVEYPRKAKVLSERIGTTLVNGNWFLRRLMPMAGRIALMHGHRHVDWIGECGGVTIISAPSPVMEVTNEVGTYFYVHRFDASSEHGLKLLEPQRVEVPGEAAARSPAKPSQSLI